MLLMNPASAFTPSSRECVAQAIRVSVAYVPKARGETERL